MWDRWIERDDRDNYRASVIAAFIVNSSGRRRKTTKPEDIIPPRKKQRDEQQYNSIEDQVAALKMIFGEQQFEVDPPK